MTFDTPPTWSEVAPVLHGLPQASPGSAAEGDQRGGTWVGWGVSSRMSLPRGPRTHLEAISRGAIRQQALAPGEKA